jgi:hypothetical protein
MHRRSRNTRSKGLLYRLCGGEIWNRKPACLIRVEREPYYLGALCSVGLWGEGDYLYDDKSMHLLLHKLQGLELELGKGRKGVVWLVIRFEM